MAMERGLPKGDELFRKAGQGGLPFPHDPACYLVCLKWHMSSPFASNASTGTGPGAVGKERFVTERTS